MSKSDFKVYSPVIRDGDGKLKLNHVDWKQSVVVRTPNWLGDALMTLPALYQLRKIIPKSATFDVVCSRKLETFWQCVPWVDNIISFPGRRLTKEVRERLIEPLNAGVAVIMPNSFGSAKDMFMPGAVPVRVGRKGNLRGALLTHRLPQFVRKKGEDTHHQVSEYFDLVEPFGRIERTVDYPALSVDVLFSDSFAFEIQFLLDTAEDGRPVLVMAPGAAYGPAKQWPVNYYSEVAKRWTAGGGTVLIIGTEAERVLGNLIVENCGHAYNLAGQTDLKELIAIIQMADVCLCNDSGAMHLAAACGAHGVAVFGSTSPVATGPLGGTWIIAQNDMECSPCLARECILEKDKYKCLNSVTPEQVYESLCDLMIYSVGND